jgi:hypothetical protein
VDRRRRLRHRRPDHQDKLWFYGGVSLAHTSYNLTNSYNRVVIGDNGYAVQDPVTGFTQTERIAGTTSNVKARGTQVQALAKLTYTPHKQHTLELLGIFAPTLSGGNGAYSLDARTGQPEVATLTGEYTALARKRRDTSADLQLKWNARTADGRWNFDTIAGWHFQHNSSLPVDGSQVGSNSGFAAVPGAIYRQTNNLYGDLDGDGMPDRLNPGDQGYREVHNLTDFVNLPAAAAGACNASPFTWRDPTVTDQRLSAAGLDRRRPRLHLRPPPQPRPGPPHRHPPVPRRRLPRRQVRRRLRVPPLLVEPRLLRRHAVPRDHQRPLLRRRPPVLVPVRPRRGQHHPQPALGRHLDDDRRVHPGQLEHHEQGHAERGPSL